MESYFSEYYVNGNSGRKIKIHTFDKIDNPTDAYFIGYMSMDGSYHRTAKDYYCMGISSVDEYLIKFFRDNYSPDTPYYDRGIKSSSKVKGSHNLYEMTFTSKLNSMFKRFGIYTYKPERIMVNIPKKYWFSYLHGVLDADGCWSIIHRKDRRFERMSFNIVSSAEKILKSIQHELLNNSISSAYSLRKDSKCFHLRVDSISSAVYLGKLIYNTEVGLPKVFNHKKYKVYCEYVKRNYQSLLGPDKRMNCWKAFEENDNQQPSIQYTE